MTKQGEIVFILEKIFLVEHMFEFWCKLKMRRIYAQTYNLSQNKIKSLKTKDNDSECLMDK